MKFAIEAGLKELKWDKKKVKIIESETKKRLTMFEDLIVNLYSRTSDVFKYCQNMNEDFEYALPSLAEKDQHFEAYQKNLLLLEGIYQFVDYVALSRTNEVKDSENFKIELAVCKSELDDALGRLKMAEAEADSVKKRCKDYMKQAQLVHEKCNIKTLHYKEVLRESKQLLSRNKDLDFEIKRLKEECANNKESSAKFLKDLNVSKAAIKEKIIEINLLEKINVEQAIEDENIKEKLQNFKQHDEELYNHVMSCSDRENCRHKRSDLPFKYEASKNLIKRMQGTMKKKNGEISKQKDEISELNQKMLGLEKNCKCLQNQVADTDGIMEENRRLWDGYMDLHIDQINKEKELEIFEKNQKIIKDDLVKIRYERDYLEEENKINQSKIDKYLKIIDDFKEKHNELEDKLINFHQNTQSSELLHLRSYLDEQKDILQDKELKFISLENEYLQAQDLLEEYEKSFKKFEELLDSKSMENDEKITNISEELGKFKSENNLMIDILGNPFVNIVVDVYIKMEELEECIEAMMNVIDCQCVENVGNVEIDINDNNFVKENNLKNHLYDDLKCKIGDLRVKCTDNIEKIIKNVDDKLEKYKLILFEEDNGEIFMSKTYENVKMQLTLVNT